MDDPGGVRLGQCLGRLAQQACRPIRGQRPVAAYQCRQVQALDVLHHEPLLVVLVDEVEHRDDVRVVDPRRQLGLALGAGQVGLAGSGRHADPLQRDLAAEELVAAEPDRPHPATADLALEGVAAGDHVSNPRWG